MRSYQASTWRCVAHSEDVDFDDTMTLDALADMSKGRVFSKLIEREEVEKEETNGVRKESLKLVLEVRKRTHFTHVLNY